MRHLIDEPEDTPGKFKKRKIPKTLIECVTGDEVKILDNKDPWEIDNVVSVSWVYDGSPSVAVRHVLKRDGSSKTYGDKESEIVFMPGDTRVSVVKLAKRKG